MALITPGHPSRNRPARALTFRRIYAPNSLPQTETDEETVPETTLWLVRLLTRLFVKAAVLSISKPLTIGRNPATCSYVLQDITVSNIHCKIYAVQGSEGGIIVSCQDMSTNGILINGHKIRGTSVLLMDGDTLEIPNSQIFKCVHLWKQHLEKSRIFDPTPPQQLTYKRIGSYTVTSHCLGSGSFASVYVAIDGTAHRQVACKIMKMKSGSERRQVKTEVKILKKLNHPNINRIYEVDDQEKFIHIFLQLCTGGDLFTYITSQRQLCEGEAQYIMFQILKGLQYIHDRTISHRDLKPENILLYAPGAYPRIQIADFGLARLQSYQETLTACGTVAYLPPEGIAALDHPDKAYLGMPSDCWSVGVTLYIMLSGRHPFDCSPTEVDSRDVDSQNFSQSDFSASQSFYGGSCSTPPRTKSELCRRITKDRILAYELSFDDPLWKSLPDAKNLASHLLIYNWRDRATVSAALESRWIRRDLQALQKAYQERITLSSP